MSKQKTKAELKNQFFWLLGITLVDFIIPDPIPLLDELVLTGWTAYLGTKIMVGNKK